MNPLRYLTSWTNRYYETRLAKIIFKRDFKAQYRRTVLGPMLSLLAPVVYLVVFIFFRLMFGLSQQEGAPAIPFLFSGLMLWMFFAAVVSSTHPGISKNLGILRKMPVNPLVFACSAAGMPLVPLLIHVPLLLLMCLYYGVMPHWAWLILPFLLALVGVFGMGLGLLVCAVAFYKRDIVVLLPTVLQLGMFVTPIFFPPDMVPAQFRWAVVINPMAHIVNMFRNALFWGAPPALESICIACGVTALAWCAGYPLFRRTLRYAPDVF